MLRGEGGEKGTADCKWKVDQKVRVVKFRSRYFNLFLRAVHREMDPAVREAVFIERKLMGDLILLLNYTEKKPFRISWTTYHEIGNNVFFTLRIYTMNTFHEQNAIHEQVFTKNRNVCRITHCLFPYSWTLFTILGNNEGFCSRFKEHHKYVKNRLNLIKKI